MADIITNTLQIGNNNLILRDADAQEQLVIVKDGLNYIEERTRNIAYINDVVIGKAWNGASNSARAVLTFPVTGSKTYTMTVTGGSFDGIVWVEKATKDATSSLFTKTVTSNPYSRNVDSNATFVTIQFNKTDISMSDFNNVTIQVEQSSTATEYIPYYSAVDAILREEFVKKSDLTQLASAFSTGINYFPGQYCIYGNKIYKFVNQHNKTAWSASDVVEVKPIPDIYAVQNEVNGIKTTNKMLFTGIAPSGTILFTSSDVPAGNVIDYSFEAIGTTGYIEFYNSSDERIDYFGKSSSSIARSTYANVYTLPSAYSYAKVSGTIVVSYITNGIYVDNAIRKDVHKNKYRTFVKRKACVTIIDDDGRNEFYTLLLPLINQYHVPIVSAYAADVANWRGDNAYMTIAQLREIEAAGGEIIAHGTVPLATVSLAEAEANVALCKANLSALGFKGCDYYVYPSGSTSEDVRSMISKYFKCAMVTFVEGQSAEYRTNRNCIGEYYIKRCHCGGAGYDTVTTTGRYANLDTSKMEYFEALIDEAIENKSWLILYTHSFQMATGTQPTDNVTQLERLAEIIEYIIDLRDNENADIDIVTTAEAFEMFENAMQFGDYLGEDLNENMTLHTQKGSAVNKLGQYDFPNDNDNDIS